jgi:hypothetical protein
MMVLAEKKGTTLKLSKMNSENFHKHASVSENDSPKPSKKPVDYKSYYFRLGFLTGGIFVFLVTKVLSIWKFY